MKWKEILCVVNISIALSLASVTGFRHWLPSLASVTGVRHLRLSLASVTGFRHWHPSLASVTGIRHWLLSLASVTGVRHWLLSLASVTGVRHWRPSLASVTGVRHWRPSLASVTGFCHWLPSLASVTGFRHWRPSLASVPVFSCLFIIAVCLRVMRCELVVVVDVATRLSPRCCERLVEVNAVHVVYRLIQSCNRSLPHMELIKYAANVLLNLVKVCITHNISTPGI